MASRCEYRVHDAVGRRVQFAIPEAQHPKSAAFEKCRSHGIVCDGFEAIVLVAVELQPGFEAHEIDDLRTDGLLAAEFVAAEAPVSECLPAHVSPPPV